ncbi:MAG: O-antigen ligase family protein [Asticcacaulis sp.]
MILVAAYATRGSDTPAPSLLLMTCVALAACLAFAFPSAEAPRLSRRPEFARIMIAAGILAAYLALQPLMLHLVQRDGTAPGLYDPSRAVLEYLKLAGLACAFVFAFRISQTDEGARRLIDAIIVSGTVWAVIAIVLHIKDPDGIYGVIKVSGLGRLTGAFSSANSAGTFFGTISLLALGRGIERFWKIRARHPLERVDPLFLVMWIISLTALIMTLSRTGIAATGLMSFILVIILCWRRTPIKWLLGSIGAGCALLIAVLASPLGQLMDRARDIDFDSHIRLRIFLPHFNVAIHQPWFGAGFGSFNAINRSLMTELNYPDLGIIQSAHNVYLQWFEECGVIGIIALALFEPEHPGADVRSGQAASEHGRAVMDLTMRLWCIPGARADRLCVSGTGA